MDNNEKTKLNTTEEIDELIKSDTNNNVEEMVDKVGDVKKEKENLATEVNDEQQVGDKGSRLEESQMDGIESNIEKVTGEMDSGEETPASKKPFNKKILAIIVAIVVVVIAGIVINNIMQNKIVSIKAEYLGHELDETKEGIVLDENNSLIKVTGKKKNGDTVELQPGEWTIAEPKTLKMDQTAEVNIQYKNNETTLLVKCSTSAVTGIEVEYKGDTKEGTEINDDSNFVVTRKHKNGTKETVNEWHVLNPLTLERDCVYDVEVEAEGFNETVSIECSTYTITELTAAYSGSINAGTVLDKDNPGIEVTVHYKNGKEEKIKDFTIAESKTLSRGETSTVVIEYQDAKCELSVKADENVYFDMNFKELMDQLSSLKDFNYKFITTRDYLDRLEYGLDLGLDEEKYSNGYYFYSDKNAFKWNDHYTDDKNASATDPINVLVFKFTDRTKNSFDSKYAKVAGEMGALMARVLGDLTFDFGDMVNNGDSINLNNSMEISWSHGKYVYRFVAKDHSLGAVKNYDYMFIIGISDNYND